MPMLRETRDTMGRIGYAYEGEPLLVWVELHRDSWRICLHRRVAEAYRVARHQMVESHTKEGALRLAFELARAVPAGLVLAP
jgi:hypothetical protein